MAYGQFTISTKGETMKTIKEAQIKNDTENKVDDYLSNLGVTYSVFPAGAGLKRDGWECDGWRVVLGKADNIESFDYFTGTGHRVIFKLEQYEIERKALASCVNKRSIMAENIRANMADCVKPFAPFAAGVLSALINDGQASYQSFNEWCAEYGYDSDSMKAFRTYQACCETGEKIRRIFTRQQISELAELLADY